MTRKLLLRLVEIDSYGNQIWFELESVGIMGGFDGKEREGL